MCYFLSLTFRNRLIMSSSCFQMQDVMKTNKHHTLLHSEFHSKNDVFVCALKARFNALDSLEICTGILSYRLTVMGENFFYKSFTKIVSFKLQNDSKSSLGSHHHHQKRKIIIKVIFTLLMYINTLYSVDSVAFLFR